ncbi:NUDIX hydrolase [Ahrensia marina]|uniref:NUDIX hydrolase n=1 Tax=Ahrensia marina TaxID=1514904 RepID=UPI0006B62846|nr:NUDIX hydrolase [Ahrensia marina]
MIHLITDCKLTVSREPLPYEEAHKSLIDVFWEQAYALNPRLWNGTFYMFSDVRIENGCLYAQAHRTDFATFLYWRENGSDGATRHMTATTFPALNDGSLLAVRMSQHTANAGRVYFPAGSFDQDDVIENQLDPIGSMKREMSEETGISVDDRWFEGPLLAVEQDNSIFITRKTNIPYGFDEVEKIWQRHQKNGGDDEICGLVQIETTRHIPDVMPRYAVELCAYHFGHEVL